MTEFFGRADREREAEQLVEQKPADYCGYLLAGEGAVAEGATDVVGDVYLCKSGCEFADDEGWAAHLLTSTYESLSAGERAEQEL